VKTSILLEQATDTRLKRDQLQPGNLRPVQGLVM